MRNEDIGQLEERFDYHFEDRNLLEIALTHSSYVNENREQKLKSNERLEFLGDAILGLIISEYLFDKYSNYPEGELTKLRAKIVCESSLAYIARELRVGEFLLLGKGEERTGGRERDSILANTMEAIIGAMYLDSNYEVTGISLLNQFGSYIRKAVYEGAIFEDYKTKLQEVVQKSGNKKIEYTLEREEGPDHGKTFYMNLCIDGEKISTGKGKNKKEGEQQAARKALELMGVIDD